MYFSLDKQTNKQTHTQISWRSTLVRSRMYNFPWQSSTLSCQSYVYNPARFVVELSWNLDPWRYRTEIYNQVNITNNLFTRDDRFAPSINIDDPRFPIATESDRARIVAHIYVPRVERPDVRTNVKPREQMTRAISRMQIRIIHVYVNMYVAGFVFALSFGAAGYFSAKMQLSPPKMPRGDETEIFPLETRRFCLGRRCLLSARLSAHKTMRHKRSARDCITMMRRRSWSKYCSRDVYLVYT